jgi:hypothetical protein
MKVTAFTSALAATTLAALLLGGCNKTSPSDTSTSPSTGSATTGTSPMTGASSAASGAASTPP